MATWFPSLRWTRPRFIRYTARSVWSWYQHTRSQYPIPRIKKGVLAQYPNHLIKTLVSYASSGRDTTYQKDQLWLRCLPTQYPNSCISIRVDVARLWQRPSDSDITQYTASTNRDPTLGYLWPWQHNVPWHYRTPCSINALIIRHQASRSETLVHNIGHSARRQLATLPISFVCISRTSSKIW